MTNDLSDEQWRTIVADEKPDVVGATAITPSIYQAERALQIAKEGHPNAVTVLGGIHATFMYQQVLSEASWIDVIVRGEGEEILVELIHAIAGGRWPADSGLSARQPHSPPGEDRPETVAAPARRPAAGGRDPVACLDICRFRPVFRPNGHSHGPRNRRQSPLRRRNRSRNSLRLALGGIPAAIRGAGVAHCQCHRDGLRGGRRLLLPLSGPVGKPGMTLRAARRQPGTTPCKSPACPAWMWPESRHCLDTRNMS